MAFVFDTNILVSAILKPDSIPAKALDLALKKGNIVFSEETRSELMSVISRNKFDRYMEKTSRLARVDAILKNSSLHKTNRDLSINCRDPKDIKFLNLATSVKAKCLVTGDADLKELNPFREIPIVSSSQFLETF